MYDSMVKVAKENSAVHNGIRYYVFGETYFCHENDTDCEFPFARVCTELEDPKNYIDKNMGYLNREFFSAFEYELVSLKQQLTNLNKERNENLRKQRAVKKLMDARNLDLEDC